MILIILPILTAVIGFYLGRKTLLIRFLKPSAETSVAWQQLK